MIIYKLGAICNGFFENFAGNVVKILQKGRKSRCIFARIFFCVGCMKDLCEKPLCKRLNLAIIGKHFSIEAEVELWMI